MSVLLRSRLNTTAEDVALVKASGRVNGPLSSSPLLRRQASHSARGTRPIRLSPFLHSQAAQLLTAMRRITLSDQHRLLAGLLDVRRHHVPTSQVVDGRIWPASDTKYFSRRPLVRRRQKLVWATQGRPQKPAVHSESGDNRLEVRSRSSYIVGKRTTPVHPDLGVFSPSAWAPQV